MPDDPGIPTPDHLSPETDSRDFVESFIVSLDHGEVGGIYRRYFNRRFGRQYTLKTFSDFITQFRKAVGSLEKISILHLREDNRRYEGADGGFADFLLQFAHDPAVNLHVEFRRDTDRLWKVQSYFLSSKRLDRFLKAQARRPAAEKTDEPSSGDLPPAETPPR
ncbi:MAG: hypothetical protein ACE5ID_00300 [Acidobacteriota bacterium]